MWLCVCVCFHVAHPWLGRLYSHRPTGVSLSSFFLSVGGEPVNRPVIAVNMEMQYSHQDCSARLMDNFCHPSHTPSLSPLYFRQIFQHFYHPRIRNDKVITSTKHFTLTRRFVRGLRYSEHQYIIDVFCSRCNCKTTAVATVISLRQWICSYFLISWPHFQKALLLRIVFLETLQDVAPHWVFVSTSPKRTNMFQMFDYFHGWKRWRLWGERNSVLQISVFLFSFHFFKKYWIHFSLNCYPEDKTCCLLAIPWLFICSFFFLFFEINWKALRSLLKVPCGVYDHWFYGAMFLWMRSYFVCVNHDGFRLFRSSTINSWWQKCAVVSAVVVMLSQRQRKGGLLAIEHQM